MGGIQNGERGGNLVSEKLICYSIFQAEEKAGQLPSSKALRKEGLQEVIEELSPSQVFFRWKEWLSKCNHLFFEGLSMLTIIYIKASLKQTSRKKLCSCSVYVLTVRRQVYGLMPFSQLHQSLCKVLCNSGDYQCLHIDSIFAFIENKSLLPNNWENNVWKLHVTLWVVWCKGHLHIFVENMLVATPDLAVVCAGFLACFLLLLLPCPWKRWQRGLWNLHNHHSNIYQSVNLRTFSWESG